MKLRECPSCSSEARMITDRDTFNRLVAKNGEACVAIECTNIEGCGLNMFCHFDSTNYDVMEAVATDRWNRRVANVQEHLAI